MKISITSYDVTYSVDMPDDADVNEFVEELFKIGNQVGYSEQSYIKSMAELCDSKLEYPDDEQS